jgi:hypothetical protein
MSLFRELPDDVRIPDLLICREGEVRRSHRPGARGREFAGSGGDDDL